MESITKLRKKKMTNRGITLIALVITIIVLLILAGVSIVTLTGQNGVLTRASTAQKDTEIESAKEQAKVDIAAWIADKLENGEKAELDDSIIKGILTGKNYVSTEEGQPGDSSFKTKENGYEIPYSDLYNKTTTGSNPPIPDGFYPVGGTVEEGFVISDVEGDDMDNAKHGNQFVWVPVPNISDFHTIKSYYNGTLQDIGNYFEPSQEGYRYSTEEAEYSAMKESVGRNKGFYIGRYEAGNDGSDNVIVQKGATVYNNIPWGISMTDATGGAVEKAKNFTNGKSYSGKVVSTLVYGVQWDATMQFMDNNYITGTCAEDSYVRNSTNKGHYGASEVAKTGSNDNYAIKNIYDMAGNVFEWTMEACDSYSRVYRGGTYTNYGVGSYYPVSSRYYDGIPDSGYVFVGVRLALYLKN